MVAVRVTAAPTGRPCTNATVTADCVKTCTAAMLATDPDCAGKQPGQNAVFGDACVSGECRFECTSDPGCTITCGDPDMMAPVPETRPICVGRAEGDEVVVGVACDAGVCAECDENADCASGSCAPGTTGRLCQVMTPVAPDGSTVARSNTRIEIVFDRYLDSRSATRQAICLSSEDVDVETLEDCNTTVAIADGPVGVFYDPAGRVVTYYLPQENPALPAALHKLTVLTGLDTSFRAFDGAPLAGKVEVRFTPDATTGLEPQRAPNDADIDLCRDARTVLSGCTTCHQDNPSADPVRVAPAGLDLSSFDAIAATGFGVAHGASLGASGRQPEAAPPRFLAGMPVLSLVGRSPGNSYLVYKVLARTEVDALTLAPGETDRLRAALTGMPMFPENYPAMADEDVRTLTRWLASGATCSESAPPSGAGGAGGGGGGG